MKPLFNKAVTEAMALLDVVNLPGFGYPQQPLGAGYAPLQQGAFTLAALGAQNVDPYGWLVGLTQPTEATALGALLAGQPAPATEAAAQTLTERLPVPTPGPPLGLPATKPVMPLFAESFPRPVTAGTTAFPGFTTEHLAAAAGPLAEGGVPIISAPTREGMIFPGSPQPIFGAAPLAFPRVPGTPLPPPPWAPEEGEEPELPEEPKPPEDGPYVPDPYTTIDSLLPGGGFQQHIQQFQANPKDWEAFRTVTADLQYLQDHAAEISAKYAIPPEDLARNLTTSYTTRNTLLLGQLPPPSGTVQQVAGTLNNRMNAFVQLPTMGEFSQLSADLALVTQNLSDPMLGLSDADRVGILNGSLAIFRAMDPAVATFFQAGAFR